MNSQKSRYYTYIRPFLKNKAVKTYSSFIFSIITIAIFSVYAIQPTVSTIVSLQKSIQEQQEILQKLDDKVTNLTKGRKNYESLDPALKEQLVNLLPYSPSLPALINSITKLSDVSQASLSGIQFQPSTLEEQPKTLNKNASIQSVEFTVNLTGNYVNLLLFLDSLKNLDRLITIVTVTFTKPEEGALLMSVHGKALYLKN